MDRGDKHTPVVDITHETTVENVVEIVVEITYINCSQNCCENRLPSYLIPTMGLRNVKPEVQCVISCSVAISYSPWYLLRQYYGISKDIAADRAQQFQEATTA